MKGLISVCWELDGIYIIPNIVAQNQREETRLFMSINLTNGVSFKAKLEPRFVLIIGRSRGAA